MHKICETSLCFNAKLWFLYGSHEEIIDTKNTDNLLDNLLDNLSDICRTYHQIFVGH